MTAKVQPLQSRTKTEPSVGPMTMVQFVQSSMVTLAHASITYSWQSCSRGERVSMMM